MVKMTREQLKEFVDRLENRRDYGNMTSSVYVSVKKHPNGREYVEFEQPCAYTECNSGYYRYDAEVI